MNPYQNLPDKSFWRLGVSNKSLFDISDLWEPKYSIDHKGNWVTFGSCFAQHLSEALRNGGFKWRNYESVPAKTLPGVAKDFNYGVFSARTGNIYTTSLLLQWVKWALGKQEVPDEVWQQDGRFYDPFRPAIEPGGFASVQEISNSRRVTLEAFRRCIKKTQYFVFTLGLTESWHNVRGRYEYPMCPGTAAGVFDPDLHVFRNLDYQTVRESLKEAIELMREVNSDIHILLTVSPVPLTATNSGNHVLVATSYSKSVLRSVAGELADTIPFVDYFPSYEIISSPPFRAALFEPNLRGVNRRGVGLVMEHFFAGLKAEASGRNPTRNIEDPQAPDENAVVCEEILLDAFGGSR